MFAYQADGALSKGDLLFVSGNDDVAQFDIDGANKFKWPVGVAVDGAADNTSVEVAENDIVLTGVLTSLSPTAGQRVYWSASNALTLTPPSASGHRVIQVGVAKNADDLHVDVKPIKLNF